MSRICFALICLAILPAAPSRAAVTSFDFHPVDNSSALVGFRTTDLAITGTGQLTGVQILLCLDSGSIYQDAFGSDGPPSPIFFPLFPSVAFDTYVTWPPMAGYDPPGAVSLGGSLAYEFSNGKLDITIVPPVSSPVFDPMDTFFARVTLSDDATGTLQLAGSTFQQADYTPPAWQIRGGQIVPEPASVLLAVLAVGGVFTYCTKGAHV